MTPVGVAAVSSVSIRLVRDCSDLHSCYSISLSVTFSELHRNNIRENSFRSAMIHSKTV